MRHDLVLNVCHVLLSNAGIVISWGFLLCLVLDMIFESETIIKPIFFLKKIPTYKF